MRQLKPHVANYPTHHLELRAVVFSIKILRHYLYKVRCTIFTEHESLEYLMDRQNLNMRQKKWLDMVKDYHHDELVGAQWGHDRLCVSTCESSKPK